jgi:hypothetical protein
MERHEKDIRFIPFNPDRFVFLNRSNLFKGASSRSGICMSATRRSKCGSIRLYALGSQTAHHVQTAHTVSHHPIPEEANGRYYPAELCSCLTWITRCSKTIACKMTSETILSTSLGLKPYSFPFSIRSCTVSKYFHFTPLFLLRVGLVLHRPPSPQVGFQRRDRILAACI